LSTIIPQPSGTSPFDAIRQTDEHGNEYWSARKLQPLMGYRRWENLTPALNRARSAARNQGMDVDSNFLGSQEIAGQSGRAPQDYRLTRFAAYLVAMNGDPNKPEVAAAQAYFAVRTHEAELATTQGSDDLDMLDGMLRALRADRKRLAALEQKQAVTAAKVAAIEGSYDWFTALGFAKLHDFPTSRPYLARVGRKASALTREVGEEPRPRQDATFGRVNTYPAAALERAFAEVSA
jgi:DNA-damage-inducible protein D